MKTFGEKIKEARKAKKMTQKDLAKRIDVAHNSISDWEHDKSKPDADTIELLCGVLEIAPNYLLATSEDEFTPAEKLLIRQYRMLSPYARENVQIAIDRELNRPDTSILMDDENDRILHLPYFGKIAAAGTTIGSFSIMVDGTISVTETPDSIDADYTIGVSGDSMNPMFNDGDIVLVKKCHSVNVGQIGIFQKGNEIFIKEATENGLRSINPQYPDMIDEMDTECLGKVLGKAEVTS